MKCKLFLRFLLSIHLLFYIGCTQNAKTNTTVNMHEQLNSFILDTQQVNNRIRETQNSNISSSEIDSSIKILAEQYQISKSINYIRGMADALFYTGNIYTFERHLPDTAITLFIKSRLIFDQLKLSDSSWYIKWFNSMGAVYQLKGNIDSALHYYYKLFDIATKQARWSDYISSTYNNMGVLLMSSNNQDKSIFYLKKAEGLSLKKSDNIGLINTWNNIALYYVWNEIYDSAYLYLNKVNKLHFPLNVIQQEAKERISGFVNIRTKNYKEAIKHYLLALKINPGSINEVETLLNLGECYFSIHQYQSAEKYLKKAIEVIRLNEYRLEKVESLKYLVRAFNFMGNLYDSTDNYRNALNYCSQQVVINDSLNALSKDKTILQLEAQFRTAEKDKTIAESKIKMLAALQATKNRNNWLLAIGGGALLLSSGFILIFQKQRLRLQRAKSREQQLAIQQLYAVIRGEENERARIGHQLHDEVMVEFSIVKMNLAALQEQDRYIRHLPKFQKLYKQFDIACIKLRQSAHNLMPDGLMEDGLVAAVHYFCSSAQTSSGVGITFEHFGEIPLLPVEESINIYRIIQELIQNVVKHAQANKILVQISFQNGHLFLTVEDNGKGIQGEFKSISGIGIKSIQLRLKAMNGKMELVPAQPNGTSVHIEIAMEQWTKKPNIS